jgi:DNA-directed RNA polymerase specialized sigma24 family protein
MDVITIPFNYAEMNDPTVVPICISDTDALGNPVHREWIDHGVVPVTGHLLRIAERLLGDKFRASEITEYAVHSLSRTHGSEIGDRPTVKVLNRARYHAVDLRSGGRRYRRKLDVELFSETLDSLEDQYDFAAALEARDTLDRIMAEVDRLGLERVKEILPYMLRNAEGGELLNIFGEKRNTITKRVYRALRKAAESAGIKRY